jgi:hypothetical protein
MTHLGSWNNIPVIITTNAVPLKNRPYKFPASPTASDPSADVISDRFGNALVAKWFVVQPEQNYQFPLHR